MRRLFSNKQKEILAFLALGKCANRECGALLTNAFEGDHIVPWAGGGETTLRNGQALCRKCNRKKGDKYFLKT